MIIRSQDKKRLIDIMGCTMSVNIECEIAIWGNNSSEEEPPLILGEYSTEEKAIKVLDMMQNEYQYIEECKIDGIGAVRPEFVFQMPQDEEVK